MPEDRQEGGLTTSSSEEDLIAQKLWLHNGSKQGYLG